MNEDDALNHSEHYAIIHIQNGSTRKQCHFGYSDFSKAMEAEKGNFPCKLRAHKLRKLSSVQSRYVESYRAVVHKLLFSNAGGLL